MGKQTQPPYLFIFAVIVPTPSSAWQYIKIKYETMHMYKILCNFILAY